MENEVAISAEHVTPTDDVHVKDEPPVKWGRSRKVPKALVEEETIVINKIKAVKAVKTKRNEPLKDVSSSQLKRFFFIF